MRNPILLYRSKNQRLTALGLDAEDAVQAIWVGHACLLVQLDGVTFLTDPALSERCSGVQVRLPHGSTVVPCPQSFCNDMCLLPMARVAHASAGLCWRPSAPQPQACSAQSPNHQHWLF